MRLRRKFGQPTRRKPTSPRRRNWGNSIARQQKHSLAIIGWMQLIHGKEVVAKALAESLTDSTEVAK